MGTRVDLMTVHLGSSALTMTQVPPCSPGESASPGVAVFLCYAWWGWLCNWKEEEEVPEIRGKHIPGRGNFWAPVNVAHSSVAVCPQAVCLPSLSMISSLVVGPLTSPAAFSG